MKRWPKTLEEALEPLVNDKPKFTTASVPANVCLTLMNTRDHVENQDLKLLLLQAAMSHQKIVSFLHYGPGQEKHHVKTDY